MNGTIVRGFELRGSSVSLIKQTSGYYAVVVRQRGQAFRMAGLYEEYLEASVRFSLCVESMQLIRGGHAA